MPRSSHGTHSRNLSRSLPKGKSKRRSTASTSTSRGKSKSLSSHTTTKPHKRSLRPQQRNSHLNHLQRRSFVVVDGLHRNDVRKLSKLGSKRWPPQFLSLIHCLLELESIWQTQK